LLGHEGFVLQPSRHPMIGGNNMIRGFKRASSYGRAMVGAATSILIDAVGEVFGQHRASVG
jgi:hypothetical protein